MSFNYRKEEYALKKHQEKQRKQFMENGMYEEQIAEIESLGVNVANAIRYYKVKSLSELTEKQAAFVIESKKGSMKNEN